MVVQIDKNIRIFVLDTGRLHQETYDVLAKTQKKYGLSYEVLFPDAKQVEKMVREGIFEETQELLADPRGLSRAAAKCLGYRQIVEGLMANEPRQETVARIQRDTRRFAKQQLTWFRRFPIRWLEVEDVALVADRIERVLRGETDDHSE